MSRSDHDFRYLPPVANLPRVSCCPVGNCPEGQFTVEGRCVSCFCAGITRNCKNTGRYRNHVSLRFTAEDDFKGTETPQNALKKASKFLTEI